LDGGDKIAENLGIRERNQVVVLVRNLGEIWGCRLDEFWVWF